jgi:hypothetical protein
MPWFMERISKGFFEVVNPFNQRVSMVPATADRVHTIVFWSKDFGPFIENEYDRQLLNLGYHLFFNFTINSDCPELEPNVPPLNQRLGQLEYLCKHHGPNTVNWRFDPICFYHSGPGPLRDNLDDFAAIADSAARWGISRCITSFMDHYPKIRRRLSSRPGFEFIDPPLPEKVKTILEMEAQLAALNIQLYTCCEKDLIKALPPTSSITPSACIHNDLLMELFGGRLSPRKGGIRNLNHGKTRIDTENYGDIYGMDPILKSF